MATVECKTDDIWVTYNEGPGSRQSADDVHEVEDEQDDDCY